MDFYRKRLKKAAWGWMESHRWNQGRLPKDRVSGRFEKRGARNEERLEIEAELDYDLLGDVDDGIGWDVDELRNWDEYRGISWEVPVDFLDDWLN